MTISTTLDSSPRPKTMNRIGRIAIGGTMQTTATSGASVAETSGQHADGEPEHEADQRRRCRARCPGAAGWPRYPLHSTISPERRSGSKATRRTASTISRDRRQQLVVGVGARAAPPSPPRRPQRDQDANGQQRQHQSPPRGPARCSSRRRDPTSRPGGTSRSACMLSPSAGRPGESPYSLPSSAIFMIGRRRTAASRWPCCRAVLPDGRRRCRSRPCS